MSAKTLKAVKTTIDFVKDCKKNKDYPYYFDCLDMDVIINFLEFKVKEQEIRDENRKMNLRGVL